MRTIEAVTKDKESNIVAQAIFRYSPYWPLFLLLFLLAFAGGWIYLKLSTPLYEVGARLMIKDEKKGTENSKSVDELNSISPKKIIENEVEVIKSRMLLNTVAENLALYASVYEKGRFRDQLAYSSAPIKIDAAYPEELTGSKKIEFTLVENGKAFSAGGKVFPLNTFTNTPWGRLKFTRTSAAFQTDEKYYFEISTISSVVGVIQSRLKVDAVNKQSSVLALSLKDEEPRRGEDILNELLTAYDTAAIQDKNILAANTLAFVEERLKNVEKDIDTIEQRTEAYRARKNAIDLSTQGKLFLENVSTNDQKLGDLNMQLAVLNQVEGAVLARNSGSAGSLVPSTLGISDPTLTHLVEKLYTTELEYEKLRSTTGENNPMMVSLTDQIQKIKPSILENIQSQRRSLEASKNNLSATNGAYTAMLQSMPEKERELVDINRQQNIKTGIYGFLLQKKEETALARAANLSDSRVVDRAEASDSPVSPKSKIIYLSSFLLALILGVGVVAGKESLSRTIMFRHEIETLTSQPVIGEISAEALTSQIVIGDDKKTFIAEQFRKLRTTLKFIGIDSKRKRIMVTSAISGEGKSFVATNLALSLALTGKRVVLVDCDLNNPSLNKKLNILDTVGVSDYLTSDADLDGIIQQTDLHSNLCIISAGTLPRNPSELIMNGRIEDLLNELNEQFDYVVVDTAPVSPVTDAYIISPLCDATLFVVRHHYTPKVFVQRIDEENKFNQLNNIAIVFNGVRSRGFGNKLYGYGYGYGYIYDNKEDKRFRIFNS